MRATFPEDLLVSLIPVDSSLRPRFEMPTERYQYVPLRQLPSFAEAHSLKPTQGKEPLIEEHLTIFGGVVQQCNMPNGIECWPLEQAKRILGAALFRKLDQAVDLERDPLASLAQQQAPAPLVVYVPPRTVCAETIRVRIDGVNNGWSLARIIVILGAQAQVKIQVEQNSCNVISTIWETWLEEAAQLEILQLDEAVEQWAFTAVRGDLKRGANFKWLGASRGGQTVRWDLAVRLSQEGAETDLCGFWNLVQGAHVHSHVIVEHVAPHCLSNQLFKGINDAGCCSSFEGLIHVHQTAQKTNAYQLNQNLLIHPTARANSKPSLDILADDVRATHGSTTGRLDPEQLFYLMSRGVPREEAKKMLTRAFCEDLISRLPDNWRPRCG